MEDIFFNYYSKIFKHIYLAIFHANMYKKSHIN